jgi:hypothetical protein
MRTLKYTEYERVVGKDFYFWSSRKRWKYFKKAIDIVNREEPASVLEMGPRTIPLVHDSHTMDIKEHGAPITYLHDARETPWPITDDRYDIFIALQVWEHLKGKQQEAFAEVARISRKAILSFPYKWFITTHPSHWNIDEKKISEWTLGVKPKEVHIIVRRAVYFFDFENSSK